MKTSFTLRFLMILFTFGTVAINGQAQIAAWDFTGQNQLATSNANVKDGNLVVSALTRGDGAPASAGANSFRTTGFKNDGILTSNTDYFQFSLSANTGYALSLSTIDAKFNGTGTFVASPGVTSQFVYSLDGTNFTLIGSAVTSTSLTLGQIDLSGISVLQNLPPGTTVTFRYYASGQTATGGWGFNSSSPGSYGLSIGGAVTPTSSSDANLSDLALSDGIVNPTFDPSTTNYTSSVGNSVNTITVTPTSSNSYATITVNGNTVISDYASQSIALNPGSNTITILVSASDGVTTKTYTVNVTRAASGTPELSITSPLSDFGDICTGTSVGPNSFTLEGSNLDGTDINIASLPGYTYSETSNGTYTSTLSFTYSGDAFSEKIIYVKFEPTMVQSYDGTIIVSGGAAANQNISVVAAGINTAPAVTTGIATGIQATTASIPGTITSTGCSSITSYGIEYSTNTGFPEGTGTQIAGSNLSGGNFSVNPNGLIPNTRYYYKAYATNDAGTTYGVQLAFNCAPLPVKLSEQTGLSFTEDFSDIANWGSFFTIGNGANHWDGLSAVNSGTIPNANTITSSSTEFKGASSGSSGGVQKGTDQVPPTESMVLLSTGSPDNNSSTAMDFYLDFTGVNASTLSFDYATINNLTGARPGSLRVYATTDGITYTEIPDADVLDFINNDAITGSKTNITLPAIFNNNPTARLRFYYHNGSTGTGSGSRPKISIDNIKVTAVATTPCSSPTAPATAFVFGNIDDVSVAASFTGTGSADNYIVVASNNISLTGNPVDGQIYDLGDDIGDGTVVYSGAATNFVATGLTASTPYHFFVFPLNSVCTGGPLYYTENVLTGNATTEAGLPPCDVPVGQATNLVFGTTDINSIQGSFTASAANGNVILLSTSSSLSEFPINGQAYTPGNTIGNATVVQSNNTTTFNATGLTPGTPYYFFIFSTNYQNCVNGPAYNTSQPLNGTQSTMPLPPCTTPSAQPTGLAFTSSGTAISGTFTAAAGADNYLIIRSALPTLSATPVDNTDYNVGDNMGGGIIISNSGANSFATNRLTPGASYYFFVFASNKNCSNGTKYLSSNPLTKKGTTSNVASNNYYFGNLHSHSDYSDGNKDGLGGTPAVSFEYAMTAQCMDFLGVSEHNHFSSVKNPGNKIDTYHKGSYQADSFSLANPNFLALYGMEWGVISGGGHVVVYGDGMDKLFGWESGSGGWGPTNNYDVYVPKNNYVRSGGLFQTVNDYVSQNTFATLAHPNFGDYENLDGVAYNVVADSAIRGAAVESGPANSTNKTYSDPGSSLYYLPYFETMLSKGYHLGPTVDHDNHYTTFGHTAYSRTAVIAPSLTKTDIIKAMRDMHFYATEDCDSKVDFTINTQIMGSIITGKYAPVISVNISDVNHATESAKIRLMSGIPGSNNLPLAIDSTIGSSYYFTDSKLNDGVTAYYYIEITNGTARVVTAPIWYTRKDLKYPLSVELTTFNVQKIGKASKLTWTTEQEINSRNFIIERSADASRWDAIETVNAAGNSNRSINYTTYDNAPLTGINYYRLKQLDVDGKENYSTVKSVVFPAVGKVIISPNPATDLINIALTKNNNNEVLIEMVDVTGRVINRLTTTQTLVTMKVSNLSKGTYFIKITDDAGVNTHKIVVQ